MSQPGARAPVLRTAAGVLAVRIGGAILQAITLLVATRYFPVASVGYYAAVFNGWGIARHIGPLGLDQVAMRHVATLVQHGHESEAQAIEVAARRQVTLYSGAVAVLASAAALTVPFGAVDRWLLVLAALGLPVYALHGLYLGQLRARELQLGAQVPESLLLPGTALVLFVLVSQTNSDAAIALVAAQLVAALMVLAVYIGLARRATPVRDVAAIYEDRPKHRSEGFAIVGGLALGAAAVRSPVILTSLVLGPAAAAVLEVATRVQALVSLPTSAAAVVGSPRFAKAVAIRDKVDLARDVAGLSVLALVPAAGLMAVLVVGGPRLLSLLGTEYEAAYSPLVLLAVAATVNATLGLSSNVLLMSGHHVLVLAATAGQLLILLGTFAVWQTSLTVTGVAAAMLVGALVREAWCSLGLRRFLGVAPGPLALLSVGRSRA